MPSTPACAKRLRDLTAGIASFPRALMHLACPSGGNTRAFRRLLKKCRLDLLDSAPHAGVPVPFPCFPVSFPAQHISASTICFAGRTKPGSFPGTLLPPRDRRRGAANGQCMNVD